MAAAFRKAAKSRQREHRERSQVGPHRLHERRLIATCPSLAPAPSLPAGTGPFRTQILRLSEYKYMVMTPACLGRSHVLRKAGPYSLWEGHEYNQS